MKDCHVKIVKGSLGRYNGINILLPRDTAEWLLARHHTAERLEAALKRIESAKCGRIRYVLKGETHEPD